MFTYFLSGEGVSILAAKFSVIIVSLFRIFVCGIWWVVLILWPFIKWGLSISCVYSIVRMIFSTDPESQYGLYFCLFFGLLVIGNLIVLSKPVTKK